jgi:hypothetical protein
MMADSNAKKRAPHTSAQKAFQRKVKRDSYLSSGFDDETEKTRMIEIFDSVVWPKLVLLGWEKVGRRSSSTTAALVSVELLLTINIFIFRWKMNQDSDSIPQIKRLHSIESSTFSPTSCEQRTTILLVKSPLKSSLLPTQATRTKLLYTVIVFKSILHRIIKSLPKTSRS